MKTQIGDEVEVGPEHPIELRPFVAAEKQLNGNQTFVPYCLIRRNLWARLHQNVMYQWTEIATQSSTERGTELIIKSNNYTFSLGVF